MLLRTSRLYGLFFFPPLVYLPNPADVTSYIPLNLFTSFQHLLLSRLSHSYLLTGIVQPLSKWYTLSVPLESILYTAATTSFEKHKSDFFLLLETIQRLTIALSTKSKSLNMASTSLQAILALAVTSASPSAWNVLSSFR